MTGEMYMYSRIGNNIAEMANIILQMMGEYIILMIKIFTGNFAKRQQNLIKYHNQGVQNE